MTPCNTQSPIWVQSYTPSNLNYQPCEHYYSLAIAASIPTYAQVGVFEGTGHSIDQQTDSISSHYNEIRQKNSMLCLYPDDVAALHVRDGIPDATIWTGIWRSGYTLTPMQRKLNIPTDPDNVAALHVRDGIIWRSG